MTGPHLKFNLISFLCSIFKCTDQFSGACLYVHLLWYVSYSKFKEIPLVEKASNTISVGKLSLFIHACLVE